MAAVSGPVRDIPSLQLDTIEFYASQTNNFATASYIGEGALSFVYAAAQTGQIWYYWARGRAKNKNYGAIYPVSPTAGVQGIAPFQSTALVNGMVVVTQTGTNQITIALKLLDGTSDPTSANPIAVQFQTASGLYYFAKITHALALVVTSGSYLRSGSGYPLMSIGDPFQLWLITQDNGDGTFELGLSQSATMRTVSDYFQGRIGSIINLSGYVAGTINGGPLTPNGRTIARLVWANGLAGLVPAQWTPPTSLILTGTGSPMPGDVVQTILPNLGHSSSGTGLIPSTSTPTFADGNNLATLTWPSGIKAPDPVNFLENDITINASFSAATNLIVSFFLPSNLIAGSTHSNTAVASGVAAADVFTTLRLYDFRQLGVPWDNAAIRIGGDSSGPAGTWRCAGTSAYPWAAIQGVSWRTREIMY